MDFRNDDEWWQDGAHATSDTDEPSTDEWPVMPEFTHYPSVPAYADETVGEYDAPPRRPSMLPLVLLAALIAGSVWLASEFARR